MGNVEGAAVAFDEALEIFLQTLEPPHPQLAAMYNNVAQSFKAAGRSDEAAEYFRNSFEMLDQLVGRDHPNRAFARVGLATLWMDEGNYTAAEPLLVEALRVRRVSLPEGHRYTAESLYELGDCYRGLGRYAEAEELILEAYDSLVESQGPENGRTRRAARRLVRLYEDWGRPDDAERYRGVAEGQ